MRSEGESEYVPQLPIIEIIMARKKGTYDKVLSDK